VHTNTSHSLVSGVTVCDSDCGGPRCERNGSFAAGRQNLQMRPGFGSRSGSRGSLSSARSNGSSGSINSDNIRVIVRCRPLNETEKRQNDAKVVFLEGKDTLNVATSSGGAGTRPGHKFRFNAVLGEDCSQEAFFETCGIKALVNSAMEGYSATVFAYGQTGSGKTYSMSGYEELIAGGAYHGDWASDGLIPRSISFIFKSIRSRQGKFRIKASFCEIYNEQVYDLLNTSGASLPVRWNPKKGFFVQDLFVVDCQNHADVMEVVSEGHRNRRVGSHDLNKDSSRSHSILTLHVESESIDPDDGHVIVRFGKIVFCDLAGSERLKATKSAGMTLTETGAINKSLFTLSNVISALSTPGAGNTAIPSSITSHVPYRDSKLTKLLMDSLGGSSLTLMICCCSPAASYLEETLNTLKYATRAAKIKNKPTLRLDAKEQLIARLREEIKLLKMENTYLREQIGRPEGAILPGSNKDGVGTDEDEDVTEGLQELPRLTKASNNNSNSTTDLLPPGLGIPISPSIPHSRAPSPSNVNSPKAVHLQSQQAKQQLQPQAQGASQPGCATRNVAMDQILAGYQREIHRLKMENREIRTREAMAERNFQNAMLENEHLNRKLDHLEAVFIHDGEATGRNPPARPEKREKTDEIEQPEVQQLRDINMRLRHQVSHLQYMLRKQSDTGVDPRHFEALRSENTYLRNLLNQHHLQQQQPSQQRTMIQEGKQFLFD